MLSIMCIFLFQVQTQGGKTMSRKEFGMQLVESLVKNWAFARLAMTTMPREDKFLIGSVFGVDPEPPATDSATDSGVDSGDKRKRNRCHLCPRASNKKSRVTCTLCNKYICPQHTDSLCKSCRPR